MQNKMSYFNVNVLNQSRLSLVLFKIPNEMYKCPALHNLYYFTG